MSSKRLTPDQVTELRLMLRDNLTYTEIADAFGVSPGTVGYHARQAGLMRRVDAPKPTAAAQVSQTDADGFHDQPWADRALCAQTDPEAFFPEKGGSSREAKKVCLSCEVRAECLEWALANEERFGIFGGTSERDRRSLKKAQPAADVVLAATGTGGPSYDTIDQAHEHAEQPTPKSYGLTYIGGTGGHRPIPLATDVGIRPAHQPKKPKPTGLDWSKHTAPEPEQPVSTRCRWCRTLQAGLVDDLCQTCRDDAERRFTIPTTPAELPTEGNQGKPTTGSSAPGATSTSSTTGRAPVAGPSTTREKNPEVAQETRPAATSGLPDALWQQLHAVRRGLAAELARIDDALALLDPLTAPPPAPAAAEPPRAAAGPTRQKKPRPSRANPETDAAIVRLYTGDENLSCPQIAERLNIGIKAVRTALDRAGIQRVDGRTTHSGGRNQIQAYPDELVAAIRTRYLDHQMTQAQVAADLDITTKVVQSVMSKHRIPARPPAHKIADLPRPTKLTDHDVDAICSRYQDGESGTALATAFGVSLPTILGRLRGRGITIRPRGGRRTNTEENQPA